MKNFKFLMPMLAFVMAVGMAFANKANVQSAGWINLDGVATQLNNDPCEGDGSTCKVIFEEDEQERTFDVYTDQTLQVLKPSGEGGQPYIIPGMPQ